jgi:hypothetical protein
VESPVRHASIIVASEISGVADAIEEPRTLLFFLPISMHFGLDRIVEGEGAEVGGGRRGSFA